MGITAIMIVSGCDLDCGCNCSRHVDRSESGESFVRRPGLRGSEPCPQAEIEKHSIEIEATRSQQARASGRRESRPAGPGESARRGALRRHCRVAPTAHGAAFRGNHLSNTTTCLAHVLFKLTNNAAKEISRIRQVMP